MIEEKMSPARFSYGPKLKQRFADQAAQALSGHPLHC
jgi:hypothetical protein